VLLGNLASPMPNQDAHLNFSHEGSHFLSADLIDFVLCEIRDSHGSGDDDLGCDAMTYESAWRHKPEELPSLLLCKFL
jgi:hypothetical protein